MVLENRENMTKMRNIPKKEMQIDQLIILWYEYHESYSALYREYLELISQEANQNNGKKRPAKLMTSEYRPSWATFLLKESEPEARSFLAGKRSNTISTIVRDGHAGSIEFLIQNLRSVLPDWHWWNKASSKGSTIFSPIPFSRSGGRHSSSYSRVTWLSD